MRSELREMIEQARRDGPVGGCVCLYALWALVVLYALTGRLTAADFRAAVRVSG